jgi:copper chaperone CopZ
MRLNKIQSLALALVVVGASAAVALSCPNSDKSASKDASTASYVSAGGTCSGHATSAANVTADVKGDCPASKNCPAGACPHGAKGASAVAAAATHEGGCTMSKSAMASGECSMHDAAACTFGKNSVTMAGGACSMTHEADYAFNVSGVDCKDSGASAVRAIKSLKGVAAVTVDYAKHMAYVCADNRTADQKTIASSLKKAGFADVKFVSQDKANCAKSHGKLAA